ncbi:hypothetical protein COK35_29905 [Bacillus cereus]|nr:hypothetical protein COK35_29905 [Bacillus cereus]
MKKNFFFYLIVNQYNESINKDRITIIIAFRYYSDPIFIYKKIKVESNYLEIFNRIFKLRTGE